MTDRLKKTHTHLWLGALSAGLALLLLFVLIPMDTETGIIEKVRRRVEIGDALAPSIAAGFILLGGLLLMLTERQAPEQPAGNTDTLRLLALILAVMMTGFMLMRYTGPALTALLEAGEYRLLRDTPPWKYLGYMLGGTVFITGLISVIERRFSLRALLVGLCATATLALLYDLPFDDLLLPPNGDV